MAEETELARARDLTEIEKKLNEKFNATTDEALFKEFVEHKMEALNQKALKLIRKNDKAFPHEPAEKDLTSYMDKQRAFNNKNRLLKAVNELHVKDPDMSKKDYERNL